MKEENEKDAGVIYEVGFHLLPTVEESAVLTEFSKVRQIVEEAEGTVISEEMPKLLVLAYEIAKDIDSKRQKFNKAYFGWVKFEADSAVIGEIKKKIENLPSVLRFIIVKTVKENTLHTPKIPFFKKEVSKEEKTEGVEKPKASEAEIDKSIDDLVTEEVL